MYNVYCYKELNRMHRLETTVHSQETEHNTEYHHSGHLQLIWSSLQFAEDPEDEQFDVTHTWLQYTWSSNLNLRFIEKGSQLLVFFVWRKLPLLGIERFLIIMLRNG